MKILLEKWRKDYQGIKCQVIERNWDLSKQSDLIEYNLLCVQGMQLLECIMDLRSEM